MHDEPEVFLEKMAQESPQEVAVAGRLLRRGSRVRLRPLRGGDLLDTALAGRVALVEGMDEDDTGEVHVAVVLEDAPGQDLREARHPAHRFFFSPSELEPVEEYAESGRRRILVAGIGNIFLGDDGFGVAVAQRLAGHPLPRGVELADFGIRGMDLAYALGGGYDAAILVDAVPLGSEPGTISVIEPEECGEATEVDSHQMNPLSVLRLATRLGPLPGRVLIVGCEPEMIPGGGSVDEMCMELSPVVAAAVERGVEVVLELAEELASDSTAAQAQTAAEMTATQGRV